MRRIDLHTHSRFSDGTLTPVELVERAAKDKVEFLVLTDHDSVSGFPEAREAGKRVGVEVSCGIEINTNRVDQVHILGYGIDPDSPILTERLEEFRRRRAKRIELIVERLNEHGVDITVEDVKAGSKESLGRPHVADALRKKGVVKSRRVAFERYLIRGKPGYVDPMGPTPEEAITLIKDVGGFSSLAHPNTLANYDDIEPWAQLGLEGLEVYYYSHSPSLINRFLDIARPLGLLATGGSDFHGPKTGREQRLGAEFSDEVYAAFMERLARCPAAGARQAAGQ